MNSASLADMNTRIAAQAIKRQTANGRKQAALTHVGDLSRFRPNLLVGGPGIAAYAEDSWQELQIGKHHFFAAGEASACVQVVDSTCCALEHACGLHQPVLPVLSIAGLALLLTVTGCRPTSLQSAKLLSLGDLLCLHQAEP